MQAQDRRRYTAPEGSTALQYTSDEAAPVASTSAVRLDGRQPAQVRPVCERAQLSTGRAATPLTLPSGGRLTSRSSHGCSWISLHRSRADKTALCSVRLRRTLLASSKELTSRLLPRRYGPKPTPPSAPFSPKARLQVEVKFAPFASGQRRFVPGKVRARVVRLVGRSLADGSRSLAGYRSERTGSHAPAIPPASTSPRNTTEISDRPLLDCPRVGRLGRRCLDVSHRNGIDRTTRH